MRRLGDVATKKSERYNPANETDSIKCIEMEHLTTNMGRLLGYTDGSMLGSIKNVFYKGDVLFGKLRPYLKKYLQAPFDGVCSSEIWVLNGKYVSNSFLYGIVQTNSFIDLANQSSGSKMPRADWNVVKSGFFCIPTLPEQKKISSFLILLDERIQTQNKIIEELKFQKSIIAKKIMTQKLKLSSEKQSISWQLRSLHDVCTIVGGGTPETNKNEYWNGDIKWFTPTEIKQNFVAKSERTITELGLKNSSAKILPKGAILLTTRATIGDVAIALEECTTNQGFQSLIVKEGFDNYFLFSWIKENKFELIKRANGSTFPEISKSAIEKIPITVPEYPEQLEIGYFLSKLDEKVDIEEKFLKRLELQKKYLLTNLFI